MWCPLSRGNSYLKQWLIEGSNDGRNWKERDRHNEPGLDGCDLEDTEKTCDCKCRKEKSFLYLSPRTQRCTLMFSSIEFFWTLRTDEKLTVDEAFKRGRRAPDRRGTLMIWYEQTQTERSAPLHGSLCLSSSEERIWQ